ncbi:transcriptional regulator [Erwiniaceae bacterium CAU 1747]
MSHDVRFFSAETLEFNGVVLDNAKSLIIFKSNDAAIKLTELQRRFMYCLMTGIVSKDEIIRNVWPGNHQVVSDNSYYQMIFQCRTLLSRHGIPADTIKTIPRFGVMLSQDTRDYHLNNDKKKEILQSGWRSRWKTWLEAVNFKLALALTLIFSAALLAGISES